MIYYQRDGLTLYHGDAREIVPALMASDWLSNGSLRFDAIVTDPVWPNAPDGLFPGVDDPYKLFADVARFFPHLARRACIHLGCNSDPRILSGIPPSMPFFRVCWLEYVRATYLGRLLYTSDISYVFGTPPPGRPGAQVMPGKSISTISTRKATNHPCPRNQQHVDWLFKWFVNGPVLDPFMGSGTTLDSALRKGVPYVGIEVEERYLAEEAIPRIEAHDHTLFA